MTIARISMLIRQHYSLQSGSFCVKSMLICDKCVVCFLKRYIRHWQPFYLGHGIPWRTHTITKGCCNLVFYSAFYCKPMQIYKKRGYKFAPGSCALQTTWWWWLLLYYIYIHSTVLHSEADSLRSHVILHEWLPFYSTFLNIHQSGELTMLAHESAAISAQVLCTPYNHAPCHFMQNHIH